MTLSLIIACSPCLSQAGVDWEIENTYQTDKPPLDVAGSLDGRRTFVLTEGGKLIVFTTGKGSETIDVDPAMDRIGVSGLAPANYQDKIYLSSTKTKKIQVLTVNFSAEIDTAGAPFLGPAKAPVEMIVFSDFECPFCRDTETLLGEILLAYPEKVKLVFKHFPLAAHKNARSAAMAAAAAHQQGKFWQYHDLLFQNSKVLQYEKFITFATELKLDMAKFNSDLVSADVRQKLDKDVKDGSDAGVNSTPSLFINGRLVKKRDAENIKKLIEEELTKSKGPVKKN